MKEKPTKAAKKSIYVFRLLASEHVEGGVTYKKGDKVNTDLPLAKMFGTNKFRQLSGPGTSRRYDEEDIGADDEHEAEQEHIELESEVRPAAKDPIKTKSDNGSPLKNSAFGKDISAKFESAAEHGLAVLRRASPKPKKGKFAYTLVDRQQPATALNDEPLYDMDAVEAAIEEMVGREVGA